MPSFINRIKYSLNNNGFFSRRKNPSVQYLDLSELGPDALILSTAPTEYLDLSELGSDEYLSDYLDTTSKTSENSSKEYDVDTFSISEESSDSMSFEVDSFSTSESMLEGISSESGSHCSFARR